MRFSLVVFSFVSVITLHASLPAAAQSVPLEDSLECGYLSGREMRQGNQQLVNAENGFTVTVPLDYSEPAKGTTEVYAYFAQPFDAAKPTYAFFTGGPGQTSHLQLVEKFNFYETLGFNLLMFDQRGIAFSRLATEELARDARNFSSENTARDLSAILDQRGIKQVSVYGASYGTVPATLFAHLFPDRTKSLILEGVVFNGWKGVMFGPSINRRTKKFFDSIPEATRARLQKLISENRIDEIWFPMMFRAFTMQYGAGFLPRFREAIVEALKADDATASSIQMKYTELTYREPSVNTSAAQRERMNKWMLLIRANSESCFAIKDSTDLNHLLMLKEFEAAHPDVTMLAALRNGKVESILGANYSAHTGKFTNLEPWSYVAENFPVKVPTFYIQGTFDSATLAPGAVFHFKKAAKGTAQLLLFRDSSHMPIGNIIAKLDESETKWSKLQTMFAQLLSGEPLTCDQKSEIEKSYPSASIALVTKGSNATCK